MAQQTAVEWLKNRLPSLFEHDHDDFYKRIFEQAKQMEKEHKIKFAKHCLDRALDIDIRTAFLNVEHYYNETYGTTK